MKTLLAMVVVAFAGLAIVPQAKADFPDYRILVNTEGAGIPWFNEGIAGKSTGLTAWRSGAVGGVEGIGRSHWSFGDGTVTDATSASVWHTYANSGNYQVSVDVYKSMGEFAWHWTESVTIYNLLEQPALNVSAANGQTVELTYDAPSLTGDPSAMFVDFSGSCNGSSYLSWTGGNISPYDAPRVWINNVLYVASKGLGQTGVYNFYACSTGPGRTDPISPVTASRQLVISVTAPAHGTANLHVDKVFLLWKAAAASKGDELVRPVVPKKRGIRLPIAK